MAKLTKDDVLKLAKLSRLHLTEEEVNKFQTDIENILGYVEQLQNVEIDGLDPTSQVTGLTNVMRPDSVRDYGIKRDDLLKNVPATQDGHIKVRRMLA